MGVSTTVAPEHMPVNNTSKHFDARNHCPFGCEKHQLEMHGYCAHLVGFTNRGKNLEELWFDDRGHAHVGGNQVAVADDVENGRGKTTIRRVSPVLKGDKLVNPQYLQKDQEGQHMASEWASVRVYRKQTDEFVAEWVEKYVGQVDPEGVSEDESLMV